VGAPTQDQALCGQPVGRQSPHQTVEWCVLAVNGLDSPGLLKLLHKAPSARFDVVVLSRGANDATGLCVPWRWARWQTRLAELIERRLRWAHCLADLSVAAGHGCVLLDGTSSSRSSPRAAV